MRSRRGQHPVEQAWPVAARLQRGILNVRPFENLSEPSSCVQWSYAAGGVGHLRAAATLHIKVCLFYLTRQKDIADHRCRQPRIPYLNYYTQYNSLYTKASIVDSSIHYTTTHIPDAHVTSGHLRTLPSFVVVKRRGTYRDLPIGTSQQSCPTTAAQLPENLVLDRSGRWLPKQERTMKAASTETKN